MGQLWWLWQLQVAHSPPPPSKQCWHDHASHTWEPPKLEAQATFCTTVNNVTSYDKDTLQNLFQGSHELLSPRGGKLVKTLQQIVQGIFLPD